MGLRSYRRMVVWTASAGGADRPAAGRSGPPWRRQRLRRWLRVGAPLTVIGPIRLARTARTRWSRILLLAGAVVTVAGISLPSGAVLIPGLLVLLAGVLGPSGGELATDAARRLQAALAHRR